MGANEDLLLKEFLIESYDGLILIRSNLVDLEKNPSDVELINNLFRAVHTLKGSASFLGFKVLKNLSHATESMLDNLRQGKLIFSQDLSDILLETFDLCNSIIKKIEETSTDEGVDIDLALVKLELFLEMPPPSGGDLKLTEETMASSVNVGDEIASLLSAENSTPEQATAPVVEAAVEQAESNSPDAESKKSISVADSVVKVNVKLLDQIMNMIGELVVNRNQILQYTGKLDDFELQKLTHQLDVITSDLQNEIMSTRMQPVGQVLNKFERVVRDLSRSQNKKVQLIITGQETELDKTLIEAIKDPLTHLIRNACDHGIELPEERVKNKKNETALLKLMAFHENGKVSIKIQDDGRGIDVERVKNKAIEKGIITKESSEKMTQKELVNLIFAPGFSTAEKVTDISGRGVGMDVVKTNIEKIGGEIDIQTVKGLGTNITLRIPLTLAIIPSLTVAANKKSYCIPQLNIVEFVLLDLIQNKSLLHQMHGVSFFRLREKLIPIYFLTNILEGVTGEPQLATEGRDFLNIVVVNGDGQEYGLVVDNIFDIEEIVVKPLSRNLKNLEYYSGATVMGNGEIALILETSSIIKKINPNRLKNESTASDLVQRNATKNDGARDFLIFSLRDNKNYGISLSLIERIEEIKTQDLNFSGSRIFTKYRDQVMPLIDTQHCIDATTKLEIDGDTIQVLVVNVQGHLAGLIVKNVFDSQSINEDIDEFANPHPALMGTVFIEKQAILVLNITHILRSVYIKLSDKENKKPLFHIDDSKMHRSILKDIIESEFPDVFDLKSFDGGNELFKYLKTANVETLKESILITDADMPEMNGWELVQEVAKNYKQFGFKTVMLTSRDQQDDREKSKDLHILEHLKKFNKKEIVNCINSLSGWSRKIDAEHVKLVEEDSAMMSQYCGFKLGGEYYAIPIMNVQEVVKAQFVSDVPKSPKEVKGLINLRGQIVTSISLRDVFHYADKPNADHMNIIVKNNDILASLMVDEILDVMDFDPSQKSNVPENVSMEVRKYFECVYKRPTDLVTIVNVHGLLDDAL